jgi:hypothetical protein
MAEWINLWGHIPKSNVLQGKWANYDVAAVLDPFMIQPGHLTLIGVGKVQLTHLTSSVHRTSNDYDALEFVYAGQPHRIPFTHRRDAVAAVKRLADLAAMAVERDKEEQFARMAVVQKAAISTSMEHLFEEADRKEKAQ